MNIVQNASDDVRGQKFGPEMILGEKLNNPYSLSNMQVAYESLVRTKYGEDEEVEQLKANHLYVRFLPKDSTDVRLLQNLNLDLFDFPLDYDVLVYGDHYHDPSIPLSDFTWQYTVVKPDFSFPKIQYEVLDECFIPDDDECTKAFYSGFASELEMAAFTNSELPEKYNPTADTKAFGLGVKPSGYISLSKGSYSETVRGVKVRCWCFVNISSGFTDNKGKYEIKNRYICNPNYAIVYENENDFAIWGNLAFLSPALHSIGNHSNRGYNYKLEIRYDKNAWHWGVVNNAAYDFYEMCKTEGINTPPEDLRIWCWGAAENSSASMGRHLTLSRSGCDLVAFAEATIGNALFGAAAILTEAIKIALPDITVGLKDMDDCSHYADIYATTWHELTHSIHFRHVGEFVWGKYIGFIVSSKLKGKDVYGDGTENSTGMRICELGESWAYANERLLYDRKFTYKSVGRSNWFGPSITSLFSLMDDETLSMADIYCCLSKDVLSIDELKQKLLMTYPDKYEQINEIL